MQYPRPAFAVQDGGIRQILVPRLSVPFMMETHGIERLHVLHCDTQGAEFDGLRSCEDLFQRRRIQFAFFSTQDFRVSGDPVNPSAVPGGYSQLRRADHR
jgi:Methyltransferase FkbM domain